MNRKIRLECLECGCAIEFVIERFNVPNIVKCPNCCGNSLYHEGFDELLRDMEDTSRLPRRIPGLSYPLLNEVKGFYATLVNP